MAKYKEPNGSSGVEKYNYWNKQFIRGIKGRVKWHKKEWTNLKINWYIYWYKLIYIYACNIHIIIISCQ